MYILKTLKNYKLGITSAVSKYIVNLSLNTAEFVFICLLNCETKRWLHSLISEVYSLFPSISNLCVLMLHFSRNGLPSFFPAGHSMAWTTWMAGSQRRSADSFGTSLTYLIPVKAGGPVSHFPAQWGSTGFLKPSTEYQHIQSISRSQIKQSHPVICSWGHKSPLIQRPIYAFQISSSRQ